ncbi:MAG: PAS domain S-box protein [Kofleriaceae bacterium]
MATATVDSRPTHATLRVILAAIGADPAELDPIFTTSQHALIAMTADRQITAANRNAELLFGYDAGALLGLATDQLLPVRLRQPSAAAMVPLADIMQVDLPGLRQDGSELRVEWVVGSARVVDREVFVVILRDREQADRALDALRSSEERFRLLVDGVRDYAIFMLDANGVVASWNRGAERIKGWTAAEIIGQPYEMFFTPEDRAANVPRTLLASAARDEVHETDGWRVRKNGERFRANAYLTALRTSTGELYGYAKVTRDLTEKYQAQELERRLAIERVAREAAQATEERLRRLQAISAALSEAATPHDIAQVVLELSLPALDASGGVFYVLGRDGSALELIAQRGHPDAVLAGFQTLALDGAAPAVEAARQRTAVFHERLTGYPPFGQLIEAGFQAVAALPLMVHGKLVGALAVQFRDERRFSPSEKSMLLTISEVSAQALDRAQLFIAETDARELAESANRSKDQFLAILGHELRNPLAPIVTALKLLPEDRASARARDAIERNVKHLVRLVDDLLDVSRITQQKVQLEKTRVELADIVERAVELTSPLVEERQHHLDVRVPSGLVVFGDSTRLAQVIANLVNNAAKYTERGGHIAVEAAARADRIELTVRDDGTGIAPEMLPHVFDLFAQESQSLERSHGGLGLGLAIVRSLVAMHDGTITASSEGRDRGSSFTLTLPAAARATTVPIERITSTRLPEVSRRILVVDDNTDAAELMAELFRRGGHHTVVAHDGPSALQVAATFAPEIAILDIGLPVMDGYELARRLRDQLGSIHLIALTGYGQASDRERAVAAGFDLHLVKPVDPATLRAAISSRPS